MRLIKDVKVVAKLPNNAASAAVIEQALRIMDRKNAWAKDDLAYAKDGKRISTDDPVAGNYGEWGAVFSPDAASFCALGMLIRARGELGMPIPLDPTTPEKVFIDKMLVKEPVLLGDENEGGVYPYSELTDMNDSFFTKKQDVVALFRKALKKLQEAQSK